MVRGSPLWAPMAAVICSAAQLLLSVGFKLASNCITADGFAFDQGVCIVVLDVAYTKKPVFLGIFEN